MRLLHHTGAFQIFGKLLSISLYMESLSISQKISFNVSSYVTYLRQLVRIQNISVFDYLGSYIVIYLLILITGGRFNPMYFTAMLPVAVLVHVLFDQKTTLTVEATNGHLNFTKIYIGILVLLTIYNYNYY